jgi:carboxymethylenebutenolidase
MEVFLTHPEEDGPFPNVIIFMDAFGLREELRDFARRIGTVGYQVALPNLFYRDGGRSFDPSEFPAHGPDPEMLRLNHQLTHQRVLTDTGALLDLFSRGTLTPTPVGCVGYCMGGRHAYAAAGTFPDRVTAMASLHGGYQVTDRADSPHLLTRRIRGECYFGFADGDPLTPPEHIQTIGNEMTRYGIVHRLETHTGTEHGFTFPERYCFSKQAAERVWERLFALFDRRLRTSRHSNLAS